MPLELIVQVDDCIKQLKAIRTKVL